ncbi:MAG TPA: cyclic-di-AMP receptor [Candidatus Limnocylindrales bacterium]|nr:cyclic-di-AMP receptor [Candidatus Limnocylindrales bacterium]
MAKLLLAVVHADDTGPVLEALREAGHRATRIPSAGGYLDIGNATIMMGVEDAAVPEVRDIFERICTPREVPVPPVLLGRLSEWRASVRHGGATIFVLELAEIISL